ncbi:hypothetical protein ACH5RR_022088 [Cinchona calisaya]|uniref:Uncharacterized protein n=1 Tax=Cinchona calisaya TaxID=153742 RepID=A0ABD2Z8P6_9GENT
MRSSCLVFLLLLFSLFSVVYISEAARKGPGDYWKSIMQDEPMPKAIKELLHEEYSPSDHQQQQQILFPKALNMQRFLTNFDTSPNVIIYHSNLIIH